MSIKQTLSESTKSAMKSGEKEKLLVLRMINAAIKQREVDERIELTDTDVLAVVDKMVKQRKDAQQQFKDAGRMDLADKEAFEIEVIQTFLPQPLSPEELETLVASAVTEVGESGMQAMGKVMAILKPQIQGRADMGAVSQLVKSKL